MRTIKKIFPAVILLLSIINTVYAQEILEIVNSPEALRHEAEVTKLSAQREEIDKESLPLRIRVDEIGKELVELRNKESGSKDVSDITNKRKNDTNDFQRNHGHHLADGLGTGFAKNRMRKIK